MGGKVAEEGDDRGLAVSPHLRGQAFASVRSMGVQDAPIDRNSSIGLQWNFVP